MSKLRENNKLVIGVGVKKSTSDLLMANCDEFIYYDDLVREEETKKRTARKRTAKPAAAKGAQKPESKAPAEDEGRKQEALDLVLETVEALVAERGAGEPIWGSMVKQALKRRQPGFSESYYGFKSFSDLLEEAQARRLLELQRDEKSGGYILRVPTA